MKNRFRFHMRIWPRLQSYTSVMTRLLSAGPLPRAYRWAKNSNEPNSITSPNSNAPTPCGQLVTRCQAAAVSPIVQFATP
jgi:hypothetical protein